MVDYREILRLRNLGNTITQIADAVRSSRHTVRYVEKLAGTKGLSDGATAADIPRFF